MAMLHLCHAFSVSMRQSFYGKLSQSETHHALLGKGRDHIRSLVRVCGSLRSKAPPHPYIYRDEYSV